MLWEQKEQLKVDHIHLTSYWRPIKRRVLEDHKVIWAFNGYFRNIFNRILVPTSTSTLSTATATTSTPNEKDNKSLLSTLNREEVEEDIDSDEETESVRIAIEQNKPIPLGSKKVFYVRRKRKYYKLRDILLEAITPKLSATTGTSTELSL